MNIFSKTGLMLGIGLACSAAGGVMAADLPGHDQPEKLRFRFELNHPLVYQVTVNTKSSSGRTMQLDTGNKSMTSRTTDEIRFKAKFTPVSQTKDGGWTLHYEPMDYEEDTDVAGTGGQLSTTIRGLTVKGTQNGITVVDTTQDIGITQSKAVKQGVYLKLLSGYVDLNPTGGVDKVNGDLPFIDFWNDSLKYRIGFFDFILPKDAVAPNDSWQAAVTLKSLEGLKLGNEGITETNLFTRQNDTVTTTNALANIDATLAINLKNLSAAMEQMGQDTMLNMPEFNHDKSTKIQFDAARGCIVNMTGTENLKMSMGMLVQGHTVTGDLETENTTTIQLIDSGN